jgi:hypothetical protein
MPRVSGFLTLQSEEFAAFAVDQVPRDDVANLLPSGFLQVEYIIVAEFSSAVLSIILVCRSFH